MALNMPPPATPQRPTPGAFVNTPAPNRPVFARSSSTQQQMVSQQPMAASSSSTLTPVERGARTVNSMLERDASYRDLETHLGQGVSGDYAITDAAWAPFEHIKTYNIPDRILEQINMTQMSTSMGLFAEINHAWATIDNQLYLWDYTNPNPETVGYEDQPHTIMSIKLVKPRPGVFVNVISHLIVVATTADILLLGVECERGPEGVHGVTMYKTDLSTGIKGIAASAIAGSSKTGRIFFADGRDTEDVYELHYSQEERWFQSKCSTTNHVTRSISLPVSMRNLLETRKSAHIEQMEMDDSRNVLYTLSSNGTIRVFHMKQPRTLELVITQSLGQILSMCTHISPRPSSALGQNVRIVAIDTISAQEANSVSLILTTSTGCRIFVSTTSGGYGYNNDATAAPTSMQVRHIRFPPLDERGERQGPVQSQQLEPYQMGGPVGYDSRFLDQTTGARRYAPGSTFFFIKRSAEGETLFLTAPQSGQSSSQPDRAQTQRFTESAQILDLGGFMQDMGLVTEPFSASRSPQGFGNEPAVQFDKPVSEFAIMSHNGIQTLRRRRLVDIFAAIIQSGGGPEGVEGDLRRFNSQYGLRETAATALAVACGQGSYVGADRRVAQVSDPAVLDVALKAFIEFGGRAHLNENAAVEGLNIDNVVPSARHDGIALYLSRIVRSIWKSPIIKQAPGPNLVLSPTHSVSKLRDIQSALIALQDFLDAHKQSIDGLSGPEALNRITSRQDEVELQGENRALTGLMQVINNIVEGIAFVLVMFEERLEDILTSLTTESQGKVLQLTFETLFARPEGKELAKELVKAIVTRNIAKGSNVETVADALRRKCGSFCSSEDVVIFKAQEHLKKAIDAGANSERSRMLLRDSLRLFEQVAQSLTDEHLSQAIQQYTQLEFYAGAIRLALKTAQEMDRGNKALSWVKDDRPTPDARESIYNRRTYCYSLIFQVIESVDAASANQPDTVEGVVAPITRRRQEAYTEINNSEDELFQNYLYDWYMKQGWPERLLDIESPFVVDYLRRAASSDLAHADLLWRYYAHYHDFWSAAEVQFELAKSDLPVSLSKRIEYLSRAKANASTRMNGLVDPGMRSRQSRQELLRSIGDYLDIANIQDDLLQRFKADPRLRGEKRTDVLETLGGMIQPLDELYHSYADQAGYYDICLLIYHAADHRDLPAIRATWTNLIDQKHHEALQNGLQAPWELISLVTESIGRRVALNENVFPVQVLLQLLLQYTVTHYALDSTASGAGSSRNNNNADLLPAPSTFTWPIDIFIKVQAPFEIIVATLEALWYAQEPPFTGRNRRFLVMWIVYTVEEWGKMSVREGGGMFGGEENAIGLADCLRVVLGGGELERGDREERRWLERGRVVRESVEAVAR
ncbi:nucleoporin-domain-containing protein [Sporormia fimetaria CBS 119925]|uniref:Nucleoporin-domain-containing protein n=1 Tax=Sporormia fimetaria CBS 119925 TaxID=1340428 RepID=A0A6A6V0C8_9PLEO|nr:nucleoporin-domain-containing protein [Sporormia fimetaria CBS 119925]